MTPILNIPILNLFFIILATIKLPIASSIYETIYYTDKSIILSYDVFIKYAVKNGPKNNTIIFFIA